MKRTGVALLVFIILTTVAAVAQAKPVISVSPVAQVDPDDDLLQDIHASLERELPTPLAPAALLVEEMASNQAQHVKEN